MTGNTFTRSHNRFLSIDMRPELNWKTDNIDIDPNTNTYDRPDSYSRLVAIKQYLRPCR